MSTEDDEKLARALQKHYEKQARVSAMRKSQQGQPSSTIKPVKAASEGVANGSPDNANGKLNSNKADTLTDAEEGKESNSRKEKSRHQRVSNKPATGEPDTSNDAELARKLSEEGSAQRPVERSSHKRSTTPPRTSERSSHQRRVVPAGTEGSSHRRLSPSRERLGADEGYQLGGSAHPPVSPPRERSSHRRTILAEEKPDTSKDEDFARKLQERENRKKMQPTRETKKTDEGEPDTSNDEKMAKKLQQRETLKKERSLRRTAKEESKVGDTPDTFKDEDLAKKLQQRETLKKERSLHHRIANEEHKVEEAADTSKDEELAKKLQQRENMKKELSSHRRVAHKKPQENSDADPTQLRSVPSDEQDGPENNADDDEALARKLEQELKDEELAHRLNEKETRRRRRKSYLARKKNQRSAGPESIAGERPDPPEIQCSDDEMGITSSHTDSFDSDDALQHRSRSRDYNDEEGRSDRSKRRARDSRGRTIQRDSRQEQAPILDLHEADEDRRLVEKLEQEMRDEELAKSLAAREARRISVYQVQTPDVSRTRRSCNFQRIASLAIPVLVILAAVVGLAFAFSGGNGLPSLPGGDPIYNNNDPFQGKNPKDVNKWNNRGSGLTLDVLNALDDRWDVNFQIAVSDWDSGNPDALTLTTQKVAVDPNCSDVTGKLKVCNDDYGATQWRGINEVIISNGYIVSSVAKLNEYYLATADEAQRQYTTCHEIGHGFGLPHTDENFYNADLGNCMDYTINPEVNQHPDASNYSFLLDLYGPSSRRRMMRGKSNLQDIPDIPEDVRLLIEEAKHEIEFQNILKSLRFKAKSLHSNEHSESIRVNLGGGYEIEVNMLLALT